MKDFRKPVIWINAIEIVKQVYDLSYKLPSEVKLLGRRFLFRQISQKVAVETVRLSLNVI